MGRASISGLAVLRYSDALGDSIRTFSLTCGAVAWRGLGCLRSRLPQGLTQRYLLGQRDSAVEELEGICHIAAIIITTTKNI